MSDELRYLSENNEYLNVSRYQVLRVIDNAKDTYLETYNQVRVPYSTDDSYHVVTHAEEGRLDIIANHYYGNPQYWWMIALANGFIDPFSINEGVMIRVPSLLTMNDYRNEILMR